MIRPWPYIILGIVISGLAAGGVLGVEIFAFGWFANITDGQSMDDAAPFGVAAAIVASLAFWIGLIFPGIPIMLSFVTSGKTSRLLAALGGMFSSSIVGLVLSASAGWYAWASVLWLALPGAVAGLLLREFAYRPIKPLPPPPAQPS